MSEIKEEINPIDLLNALERGRRSETFIRKELILRLKGFVKLLDKNSEPDGLTIGSLGGIQYCINELQKSFSCRDLSELEERFAGFELTGYPSTKEELDRTLEHYKNLNLAFEVDTCKFGNDQVRYRLTSNADQFDSNGKYYRKDKLLPSIDKEFPSLDELF